MKLDKRWESLVFSTLMSGGMTLAISTVTAVINIALGLWDGSWGPLFRGATIGFGVGIPAAIFLVPRVRSLTERLITDL